MMTSIVNKSRQCLYCPLAAGDDTFMWDHIMKHLEEQNNESLRQLKIPVCNNNETSDVKSMDIDLDSTYDKISDDIEKLSSDQLTNGNSLEDKYMEKNTLELKSEEKLDKVISDKQEYIDKGLTEDEINAEKLLTQDLTDEDILSLHVSEEDILNSNSDNSDEEILANSSTEASEETVDQNSIPCGQISDDDDDDDILEVKDLPKKVAYKKDLPKLVVVNKEDSPKIIVSDTNDSLSSRRGRKPKGNITPIPNKVNTDADSNKSDNKLKTLKVVDIAKIMKTSDNKKVDVERKKAKRIEPAVDLANNIEELEYDESSINVFEIEYLSQQTPDQIKKFISPSYKCPVCSESHQDFGAHMSLSHGLLRCGKDRSCHKFFENMDDRSYHEERAHGGGNSSTLWKIICGHCKNVKFPDTYTVVEHRYSEHSFFTCTLCSMITTKDEYYQIHMKSHGIRNTNILNLKDRKSLLENLLIYPIAIVSQESMTAVCYLCPTMNQEGFDIRSGGEKLWDHFKIGHKVKNPAEALLRLFNGKQFHFNTLLNDKKRIAQMEDDLNKQMEDDLNKQMEADRNKQMEKDAINAEKLNRVVDKSAKIKNKKELKPINSKTKTEPEVFIKIEPEVIIKTEPVDTAEVETVKVKVKPDKKRKSSTENSTIKEASSINVKTEPGLTETQDKYNDEIFQKRYSTLECKPGETYYCDICKDHYTDNGDHLCFKHGMVKCGSSRNCHLFFGSYNEKREHVEEAHVDTFSCMPCDKKFSNVYSQLQHRNENHAQLTCMLCFVGFKCQEKEFSYFKIHMKTHNIPETLISSLDEKKLFEKLLGELVVNFDKESMAVSCNLCSKPTAFSVQQNGKDLWAHFEKSHKIRNAYEMLHLFNGSGFGFSNKEVKTWSHSEVIKKESTEIKSNDSAPSKESGPTKKRGRPRKVSNITGSSTSDQKLGSDEALDELYGLSESPKKRAREDDNDQVINSIDDIEKDKSPKQKHSKVDLLLSKVEQILSEKDIPKKKRGRPSKASKLALEEQVNNINQNEAFSDDSFAKQTADIDDILKNYEALDTEETHEERIPDSEADYEKSDQEKGSSIEEVEKVQFLANNYEQLPSDSDEDLASDSEDSDSENYLNAENAYKKIFLNSKVDSAEPASMNEDFFKKKIFNYEGVDNEKALDEKANDKEIDDEQMNDMEADDDKQANELEDGDSEEESDEYQINYKRQLDGEEMDDEQDMDKKADDEQENDEEADDEQDNDEEADDEQENDEEADNEQENDEETDGEQENDEEIDDEQENDEETDEEANDEQVNDRETIDEQINDLEGDDSEEESDEDQISYKEFGDKADGILEISDSEDD